MPNVNQLITHLGVTGDARFRAAMRDADESTQRLHGRLTTIRNAAGAAGAAMTAFAVTSVRAASNMQRELASLKALGGSASFAAEEFARLDKRASESISSLSSLTAAAKLMKAFGLESQRWLTTADDLAAGMNATLEETTRALGRLKSGDFGEAFERLRDFGISRSDLEGEGLKFDKSGQYQGSVEAALNAVETIVKRKFGGLSKTLATETLSGALSNLGDSWERFTRQIGNDALPQATSAVRSLSAGLDTLREHMGPLGTTAVLLAGPALSVASGAAMAASMLLQFRTATVLSQVAQELHAASAAKNATAIALVGNASLTAAGKVGTLLTVLGAVAAALGIQAVGTAIQGEAEFGSGKQYASQFGTRVAQGTILGAAIGSVVPGLGTMAGAGAGAVTGGVVAWMEELIGVMNMQDDAKKRGKAADARLSKIRSGGKDAWRAATGGRTPRDQILDAQEKERQAAQAATSVPGAQGGGPSLMDQAMAAIAGFAYSRILAGDTGQPQQQGMTYLRQIAENTKPLLDLKRSALGGGPLGQMGITGVELTDVIATTISDMQRQRRL